MAEHPSSQHHLIIPSWNKIKLTHPNQTELKQQVDHLLNTNDGVHIYSASPSPHHFKRKRVELTPQGQQIVVNKIKWGFWGDGTTKIRIDGSDLDPKWRTIWYSQPDRVNDDHKLQPSIEGNDPIINKEKGWSNTVCQNLTLTHLFLANQTANKWSNQVRTTCNWSAALHTAAENVLQSLQDVGK